MGGSGPGLRGDGGLIMSYASPYRDLAGGRIVITGGRGTLGGARAPRLKKCGTKSRRKDRPAC